MRIETMINKIRKNLSDDLLKPKYRIRQRLAPSAGHCYVSTEALYHMLTEGQQKKYRPHYLRVGDVTHWYLMTKKIRGVTNILDPTYDQFTFIPDYEDGTRAGFLTKKPSKRTLVLLKRIKNGRIHRKRKSSRVEC